MLMAKENRKHKDSVFTDLKSQHAFAKFALYCQRV